MCAHACLLVCFHALRLLPNQYAVREQRQGGGILALWSHYAAQHYEWAP